MRHRQVLLLASSALLTALIVGCKEGGPGRQTYLAKGGASRIRVAVIPFDSPGLQAENAARIVNEEVVTSLVGTGAFDVVEPGIVYQAITEAGARNLYGLDLVMMQKLQEKIGPVRAFVVGMVQEYGEVRVGPVSYPSISVSARVLDSQTGSIVWTGSVSRTGADSEKVFGIGAVHSSGRLARAVVAELIRSANRQQLAKFLQQATPAGGTAGTPGTGATGPGGKGATTAGGAGPTGNEKYMDEAATYTQAALSAFAVDVTGLTRGPATYREHYFPIVEVTYDVAGAEISVELIDCLKRDAALARIAHEHPDETEGRFKGLPAYSGASSAQFPGAYHLDVAAGRFVLMLAGPSQKKSDIEAVAQAIITAMQ